MSQDMQEQPPLHRQSISLPSSRRVAKVTSLGSQDETSQKLPTVAPVAPFQHPFGASSPASSSVRHVPNVLPNREPAYCWSFPMYI